MNMHVRDIARAVNGIAVNVRNRTVKGISIDTRTIRKGEAFLAFRGDRFDGHDFIEKALARGAALAISSNSWYGRGALHRKRGLPLILVADTLAALGDLAHSYRRRFRIPLVGVTGSTGKTTVKEIIAHILSSRYRVLKNEGSRNNLIGLPLTLFNLTKRHEACVLEMGTNRFGEIRRLSAIAEPGVGVITNIGNSHLEFLKNLNNVKREKAGLIEALGREGIAVLNKDDPMLERNRGKGRAVYFGIDRACEFRAARISYEGQSVSFTVNGVRFTTALIGRHNVYNALAGIAVGSVFGLSHRTMARSLKRFKNPMRDRLNFFPLHGIIILDDTYNSNPLSFRSAVESLSRLKTRGRRVIVSSDMHELGDRSDHFHREAGRVVARHSIDLVVGVGDLSRHLCAGAARSGMPKDRVLHFNDRNDLSAQLESIIKRGDTVLVKGSRKTSMDEIVARLKVLFGT